jgi:di/tricarboxylate transporter
MLLLIVGTLAMAGALSATGAGDLIGGFITDFTTAVKINNKYIIGLIFFLLSFLLAQFMSNRGAMLIFYPIAIAACHKISGDPRGLLILIEAGALTAFMTPMPTAAVPDMMNAGGYRQKDLVKGGWLFSVLSCAVCVLWIMSVFPVK